jgi:hypothetical protein
MSAQQLINNNCVTALHIKSMYQNTLLPSTHAYVQAVFKSGALQ